MHAFMQCTVAAGTCHPLLIVKWAVRGSPELAAGAMTGDDSWASLVSMGVLGEEYPPSPMTGAGAEGG